MLSIFFQCHALAQAQKRFLFFAGDGNILKP
jgi:hypothetical protein